MFYFNLVTLPLLANKIQESKLVKGVTNLLNDATSVAIALCAVLAGLCWVVTSLKLQGADENETPAIKKKMKLILIACVVGACGSVIIKLVLSYFE